MTDPMPPDWHQWRGGVDARLDGHDDTLKGLTATVNSIDTKVDGVHLKLSALSGKIAAYAGVALIAGTIIAATVGALISRVH